MIRSAKPRFPGPITSIASHAAAAVLQVFRVRDPSRQRTPPDGSSPVLTKRINSLARA